jgi:hypothetical protein
MEPLGWDEDAIEEADDAAVRMNLRSRFDSAWADRSGDLADPVLVPTSLAQVCRQVLAVDGAGLSTFQDEFRMPLGASDSQAAAAEQLQFTQGEGPCLDAVRHSRAVVADEPELQRRWPLFAQALRSRTRYRAVVSVPLDLAGRSALDLYLVERARLHELRLADVLIVAELAADVFRVELVRSPPASRVADESEVPLWLMSPSAQRRQLAWVAAGMIMQRYGVNAADAVALLRGYAYGHDSVVDDIAAGLIHGTVALSALQP